VEFLGVTSLASKLRSAFDRVEDSASPLTESSSRRARTFLWGFHDKDLAAQGRDNGLLQAWEIFEQIRINADLVTLSACKTGLGQEFNGEGLLGLTRAFQYAGARAVLASLWSVDDFQTMRLMRRFYAELRAGTSQDKALQAAQLELLRSKSASAPYYWAGFMLFGDAR
jgi:CHAT domain-containing protein